jgi:hypothetical protein
MNIQRILTDETETLCLMPVSDSFSTMENSSIPEAAEWRHGGTELPLVNGFLPDQEGSCLLFPSLAFGAEDEDEEIDDDEDNFDDMEDDFDDDFDDDDDDFDDDFDDDDDDDDDFDDDYDEDTDYDDDFEE